MQRTDTGFVPTTTYARYGKFVLYEPGTTTLIDGGTTIRQVGATQAELAIDVAEETGNQPYALTRNTILEFEFRSGSEGRLHAVGWDVDFDSTNDSGQLSKRQQLHGTGTQSGYLTTYNNYSGSDWVSYSIPIASALPSTTTYDLVRLVFVTDAGTNLNAESQFRNIRFRENAGTDGTHWSQHLVIPSVNLDSINITYDAQENVPEIAVDDTSRSQLLINGAVVQQGASNQFFLPGDNVKIHIDHQSPSEFGISTSAGIGDRTYTREPGQILAINFDANQYSRQHIIGLQSGLNDLLLDGDDVSDIDDLLSYAGAKYWYEFNRSNRVADGLLHTIGTQQWVGSGIVTADPFLLEIPDEAVAHLQFPIVPHDMGVDLPNVTHASYDATTGEIGTEAFQLMGYNSSALENAILEDVINSESISTIRGLQRAFDDIRGLRFDDSTISREAVQVFESVPNGSSRTVYFRGEIGENVATPYVADRTNMPRTRQQLLDSETGGLKNHVKEANSIADILENVSGQATGNIRVLVPRSRAELGDWTGTVYVAEYETADGRVGSYIISPDGGTPTEGGYSGNVVAPKNLQLPEASFRNQTYAGDPVNVANGNMFRDEVDFRFANRDVPLDFSRHYDSQNNMDVGFGVGWTHSFTGVLYREPGETDDNKIVWLRADGQRHTFERPNASAEYEVPTSLHGSFETILDGGVTFYVYRENDGTQYWFEGASFDDSGIDGHVVGRLAYVAARNDDGVSIGYASATSLRVSRVEDYLTYQRHLEIQYTPISALVKQYDDSQLLSTWQYNFAFVSGGSGHTTRRLTSVTSGTDQFVTVPAIVQYQYYTDGPTARVGLIKKIIEPNGESHEYEYYANGRVFQVTDGEGHQQTFSYNLFRNLTEFTDERGNVETYLHQDNGLLERQIHADRSRMTFTWGTPDTHEESLMKSSSDEVGATETFTYYQPTDSDYRPGELKRSVSKDGIATDYEYWVSSNPNYAHISELSKITVVDPNGPDLVTQYTDRDERGMLKRMEDAAGNVTEREYFGYDTQTTPVHLLGRLKSETQPKGVEGDEAVTWQPLADEFTVTGDTLTVRLLAPNTEVGNKRVIADAIRIDRVDDDAVLTRIIDDDQSGTSPFFRIVATGGVGSSTTPTQPKYEGDATSLLGTASEDRSASWIFTDLLPGTYRVSAVWTWYSDRDSAAHYELFDGFADGGNSDLTADVDQTVPPEGFHSYQTVFDYDTAGNVISAVTEGLPSGTQTYDSYGNVVFAVDATGAGTTNVYDVLGRLIRSSVSSAASPSLPAVSTTVYQYDPSGRLLSSTDAVGRTTTNEFDAKGDLTKQTYADGTSVEFEYDEIGNQAAATDQLGRTTRFIYDSRNRLIQTNFADGTTTRKRYDGAGRVIASFDELGRATAFTYDKAGRVTLKVEYARAAGTSSFNFDDSEIYNFSPSFFGSGPGNGAAESIEGGITLHMEEDVWAGIDLAAVISPDTVLEFDFEAINDGLLQGIGFAQELNQTVEVFPLLLGTGHAGAVWPSSAQLITSAFADYLIGEGPRHFVIPVGQYLEGSSYNYLVFINDDDATDFINPLSGFDVESYFSNVKIAKSVTPSAYDPYGTLPITLGNLYDSLGRLSEQADANHNKTSYKYDALGRVVETRVLDNGSATLPPMFLSTTSYDANGNVAAQVVYDVPGLIRPISEGGAGLSTIPFPSDPTPLIDSYPEFVHKVNTRYDAFGRPVETTTADGTSTSTIYDAAGRVRYGVDELGRRTERQYDEFGRLERTIAPDPDGAGPQESSATRYERDAYGNVTHEWQYFGTYEGVANVEHDNRYVYDSRNRLVTTFMKDDAHRTDMMYDAAGRRIATTDALGNTSYTLLDERGRVLQERLADPDGIGKQFAPVTTYEYDAVGNVTMSRDALGSETRFSYDSLNRLREEFTQHSEIADDSESTSPAFTPDANAQYYTDDITAMVGRDVTWWELGSSQTATWTFDNLQGGDYRVSMTWLPGAEYDDNATVKIRVNGTLVLSTALDQRQNPNDFRSVHGNYDIGWKIVDESVLISNGQTITVELSGTGSDYLNADAVRLDLWVPRSYSYDKNGNLLAATDTLGRTTDFAYDELNRQTSVKLPDPDGAGSLGRRETRSSYDGYGNLIQSVDTRGTPNYDDRTDTFAYDKRNRLVAETLDAGSTGHLNVSTTYEYDAVGNQTLVTDPLGFQAHYRYDAADRLIDEYRDFGDGRTAALQFSSSDITDPYPTYYTGTHELSAGGDELTLEGNAYVLADIGSYAVTHRTVLEFDLQTEDFPELALIGYNDSSLALNRYFELTGSNSYPEYYSTEFRQERLPDSTERFHIPIGQYLTDAEKANGLDITLLEFYNEHLVSDLGDDALPRVTFSNIRLYESDEVRTVTTYDTRGNLETVREASDPRNITTSYRYDILGQQSHEVLDDGGPLQRIFTTTYDAVGNVLVERNHTAGTETRFEYDDLYRLTKTTLPDPDGNPATPNGLVTTFGYDIAGNLIRETNGEAESTYSDYDPQGRVVAEWDGNGDETRYRYDSEGNLRALTDAAQNTTTYAYDALDRVTTETNALDHSRTYVYEKQGNLAKVTDRNGRVREFAYDALDRRLTEKWRATAGGSVVHTLAWDYDDLGRVTQQDDGGVIDTFAYDGLDRLVEQTNYDPAVAPGSSGRPEIRQTYEYSFVYVAGTFVDQLQRDQFVRTTSDEIPLAATISRYDRLGQLVLTVDFDTDSSSPAVVLKLLKFAHDAAGNLQEIDRYGGPTTDLVYDQANRLTSIVHDLATDDITHSYAYDNASRITSFDTTPDNYGIMSRGYTYDEAGQLTDATGPVVEDYAYDANGNRVSAGGQAVVTDAANRVVDDGTYTYQYDIEGNLSGRTLKSNTALTSEYVWDHRNRLTSVTEKNGTTVTQSVDYTYDAQGRRVRRTLDPDGDGTQPATNEYFVYDGSQLAMTFAGSTGGSPVLDHRYLYGPAGQVLVDEVFDAAGDSDEVLWQLADHQGTIRDIVDDNGVVRRHVDYDSFGYILNISWFGYNGGAISPLSPQAVDQLFYYTGQERDDATGLQLHGARWYDPATARWLSEDPIAFDGGDPNLYRYVGNSALNFTDPTGTTQAGNPLSSLPSVSNQSASTFLNQADQYFANQRLSGSLYGSPSQSFTGPTRSATVAPSSDPGLFSTIGSLAYDYVIEPVGSGLTYAGNSIRNKADNLAGRIENVTTTGNTGILGTSLAVYGGLEAHAIRLVGGAVGGVIDVPGTARAAIDDLRTTKRVYDQYGTATAAARQIGLLQGAEAYYGTDVLTYEQVELVGKLSEAAGRFGGTAGTAAGIGSGVTRLVTPKTFTETLTHRNGIYEVLSEQPISGTSRSAHRAAANRALLEQLEGDLRLSTQLGEYIGVDDLIGQMRTGRSGLRNPTGTVWHHPIENPGVIQLLRREVHRAPELQPTLHPGPQNRGGYGTFYDR
jgi:RHS repeat-associated protein